MITRRKTPSVFVGPIGLGRGHPVVIQSMTNTQTADVAATVAQVKDLAGAGSELVRITINDELAARAAEKIILALRRSGDNTPIVGDFHYNGHLLLEKYPDTARLLSKYRINPGNVGRGKDKLDHFARIVRIAVKHKKPVRIGVNAGSLDQELLASLTKKHGPVRSFAERKEIFYETMVRSALQSARLAEKLGLPKNKIVLSAKMSDVQDMVAVYEQLAKRCDYVLHLGLTEAGARQKGIIASVAALSILLQKGIGDTIRISLTPTREGKRSDEVVCCKELLQALGLRYFKPTVVSCPGCGRTNSSFFERLVKETENFVLKSMPRWQKTDPKINELKVAVMGCVVNGPGESKHANIGLSLPGRGEAATAVLYTDGKLARTLRGKNLTKDFFHSIERYVQTKYR